MEKVFVIADVHGSMNHLDQLLTKWQPKTEQIVFLGDYIDRGPNSLEVLQKVRELEQKGAVALQGNHEVIFYQWLKNPKLNEKLFLRAGGAPTIKSFLGADAVQMDDVAQRIQIEQADIIKWMERLPLYYEWDNYFFVHAGIDPYVERPTDSTGADLLWIREAFHFTPHKAKETIVFGHTQTHRIRMDESHDIWISPCRKKIGIDGGVRLENGCLHGIVLAKGSRDIIVHAATEMEVVTTTCSLE